MSRVHVGESGLGALRFSEKGGQRQKVRGYWGLIEGVSRGGGGGVNVERVDNKAYDFG